MSLLQDALRKAQKGHAGPAFPEGGPLPGAGGPARSINLKLWGAIALAAVFLAGAATVALFFLSSREDSKGSQPPAVAGSAPPAPIFPAKGTEAAVPKPGGPGVQARAASAKPVPPRVSSRPSPLKRGESAIAVPQPDAGSQVPPPLSAPPPSPALQSANVVPADGRASQLDGFNEGIAAQTKGDWEAAARLFQEVVSKDPSIVEGWSGLGNALLRLGKLPEADRALRKALSLDPNYPMALMNAGLLRLKDGRVAEAAACFARASSLDPRNPSPRVNLAIAQARRGALAEAEETLTGARRAFPSNPDILYHLGTVYERTGARDKAREAYSSFLDASAGRRPDRERLVRDRLKEL